MSLRECALTPAVISAMAALADMPEWTDEAIAEAVSRAGWGVLDAGRAAIDDDHTVVFSEVEISGGHEWAYVAAVRFYEPDDDEDPDEDELAADGDASPCWALSVDADRAAFDRAWERQRDAVAATLGRLPGATVTDDETGWRAALWRVGEHALVVAQTEDFDSYSLFDMVALWLCRRPADVDDSAEADYPWMAGFPAILAASD